MNILAELRSRFAEALSELGRRHSAAADEQAAREWAAMVLPSQDPRFGDYQANCAMPLGKRLGKPPREIAAELLACLRIDDLCAEPEIAGPGFVNLRLRDDFLARQLAAALADEARLAVPTAERPRTIVVDYSSPNVAKPMHVGHIRSTVIGDALCRVLRFLGHRVISDNHIGDWGTQFGMILYGYKHFADVQRLEAAPVAELSRLYRLVHQLVEHQTARRATIPALEEQLGDLRRKLGELPAAEGSAGSDEQKKLQKRRRQLEQQAQEVAETLDAEVRKAVQLENSPELSGLAAGHPDVERAVLRETAALHAGDPANRALWERFLPACLDEMESVYRRLGVTFDHALGESFYHAALPEVVASLEALGLARESDGAKCVFLEGIDAPFLVQKQDGAFLYATTDLATIDFRLREWNPDAILYVVDHRQSLHFQQLFATARLWRDREVELTHVSFGTVLGEDGKPFKTRSGSAAGLAGLLDEAVERALAIVNANDDARPEPLLSPAERREVARRVGLGAVKYADLSYNRTSDYKFSYDKMLAMTGNTAAYMQYSYARVRSIFDKGDVDPLRLRADSAAIELSDPAERSLAIALLQFSEALDRAAADYRPNHLTDYLFDLAGRYAAFFETCPVLKAESDALRTSRLKLCDLAARTLACGLGLLGIEVVERM
jgi:arginyl-tRNA synthetase